MLFRNILAASRTLINITNSIMFKFLIVMMKRDYPVEAWDQQKYSTNASYALEEYFPGLNITF